MWSECRDSNPGPPAPKAGALPTAQHPVMKLGDPAGRILPNQARYQLRYTRIFTFCHYTTAERKIKDFPVCGHSCGQNRFYAVFGNRGKSRKRRCYKALRRFVLPCPGYHHGTPKAGALPTAQHPVMKLGDPAGRILPKLAPYQLGHTRIWPAPDGPGLPGRCARILYQIVPRCARFFGLMFSPGYDMMARERNRSVNAV